MSTPATRKRPAKRKARKPRTAAPIRERENTSTIALFPWQVARELLIAEREVYKLFALGPARGGIRAMCLGDPNGRRPRKVVHRADFDLFVEFKRGLLTAAEYTKRAGAKA